MAKSLLWLSDEAWRALSPHLPRGRPGKPRVDDRTVISGIPHVLKTGCRWRDVSSVYGPPTTIYNRYNRWSQRRIWQRIFEKMAAAGPIPDELSIDSSHVKAHRSASGSKRGSLKKRSAARGAEGRARSMLWPDDRGRPEETSPTSSWPFRFSAPSLNQSACWRTRPTTPTACADGSSIERSERPFPPPPRGARHTRSIAPPISAETSSNACSASSRIGDASQPDTTASLETISPASLSPPSSSHGPNYSPT